MATATVSYKAELKDLRAQLAKVTGVTRAEARKMVKDLDRSMKKVEKSQKRAAKAAKVNWAQTAMGLQSVGQMALRAGRAIVDFGQHVADLNNQLTDASTRTGLTVNQLAGLKLAAEGSGVAFTTIERGLNRLPQAMNEASRGSGTAAAAFEKMGVDVRDASTGGLRDAADVLPEIFAGLNKLPDPASKSAAAMDIFGAKAGGALVQSGAIENLESFVALADQFGIQTGPQATRSAADFQRQMATMSLVADGELQRVLNMFGGSGGLADVIQLSTTAIIVMGSVFAEVFGELNRQIQSVIGPMTEVALKVIEGDLGGALKAVERNAAEFGSGFANLAPGVLQVRIATAALEGYELGVGRAHNEAALLNDTLKETARVSGTLGGVTVAGKGKAGAVDPQKAIDAMTASRVKAAGIVSGLTEHRLTEIARLNAAESKAIAEIADLEGGTLAQMFAVEEEFARRRIDLQNEVAKNAQAKAEETAAYALSISQAYSGAASDIAGATSSALITIANSTAEGNERAARTAFALAKAVGIAQVGIDTAAAVSRVNATWAAAPPVALALSIAAVAVGAAQAGAIAAQQPSFHSGGPLDMAPDEMNVTARRGEFVMNPQGRAALGDQTLERANAGMGGGSQNVIAVSVYKHTRQVDRWKRDGLDAGDPIARAITAGRLVGHRSNR